MNSVPFPASASRVRSADSVSLYEALFFVALALFVAWRRNRLQTTIGRVAALVTSPESAAAVIDAPLENNRFPYAPAIAIGSLIAAIGLFAAFGVNRQVQAQYFTTPVERGSRRG